jgi:hypothetical protein
MTTAPFSLSHFSVFSDFSILKTSSAGKPPSSGTFQSTRRNTRVPLPILSDDNPGNFMPGLYHP